MESQVELLNLASLNISLDIKCMNLKIMMFHLLESSAESLGLSQEEVVCMVNDMTILGEYMDYLPRLVPILGETLFSMKFKKAGVRIRKTIAKLIDKCLETTSDTLIIRGYIRVCDNREWLICDVHALLFAGHDSTSHATQFVMHEMSKHQVHQDACRNDLLKGGTEYLDAVIHESLRLNPIGAVR